jgi:hypothetical protein
MIKQLCDNCMLYSQVAQDPKMSNMKVFSSHDDQVQRCLDLLKNYILHHSVILQPDARDSMVGSGSVVGFPFHRRFQALAAPFLWGHMPTNLEIRMHTGL